jgi:hypothetical protein
MQSSSGASPFRFPASGASRSSVAATTVDQSFTQEAAATVAKTGSKTSNKKKNKKKNKK